MTIRELEEGHPIYVAIDRGGGQTCDINGVVRALDAAGYVIVPKEPTAKIIETAQEHADENLRLLVALQRIADDSWDSAKDLKELARAALDHR
jgi:regulator of RNase E activity RraA